MLLFTIKTHALTMQRNRMMNTLTSISSWFAQHQHYYGFKPQEEMRNGVSMLTEAPQFSCHHAMLGIASKVNRDPAGVHICLIALLQVVWRPGQAMWVHDRFALCRASLERYRQLSNAVHASKLSNVAGKCGEGSCPLTLMGILLTCSIFLISSLVSSIRPTFLAAVFPPAWHFHHFSPLSQLTQIV